MTAVETFDIRSWLRDETPLTAESMGPLQEALTGPQVSELRQELGLLAVEVASGKGAAQSRLRIGIAFYILGQHRKADEHLSYVADDAVASFYHALVLSSLDRHEEAAAEFEEAGARGYDPLECALRRAGEVRMLGDLDDAESILRSVASDAAGRAEYSYQLGCIWSDRGDTFGAIEYFERAVDMAPHHSRALFRLAAENSLRGNDDEAIRLYEQSLSKPPYFLGALLNLGLLYEDVENYKAAEYCFRRILDVNPVHNRARLYLKDIEATEDMYYDEEVARREARLEQLYKKPVADFELSVRARNCLQAMDIETLGDLTEVTEQELLGGKNFGETSLHEIQEMMAAHGLQVGQNVHKAKPRDTSFQQQLSPEEQVALNQPIPELNLSVRARKCMSRLGLATIGELIQRTPDELLSSRNFGVTSLNEVRAKLTELGLSLRND